MSSQTQAISNLSDATIYVTSLEEVVWGILLLAITISLHAVGMLYLLRLDAFLADRGSQKSSVTGWIGKLIFVTWLITCVHLFETLVWAVFFCWKGAMPNFSTSFYFALMDYTTLGSQFFLPQRWRLLGGMIAIAGLLTMAWSTGVLMTLAGKFTDRETRGRR